MESPIQSAPEPGEYAEYYSRYISLVKGGNVLAQLDAQLRETTELLREIPEERSGYRYGPDKWTIKDVVGHVVDGERVFGYRALVFARGDACPLPSFEQDDYVKSAAPALVGTPLSELAMEFETLRRSHLLMFRRLTDQDWLRRGMASGNVVSVRAMAHIMVGHVKHHLNVLRERYLS
jgi:hypothetical protein